MISEDSKSLSISVFFHDLEITKWIGWSKDTYPQNLQTMQNMKQVLT